MNGFFLFVERLISGGLPFLFLIFSGIYFTVKSGFFQLRFLPASLRYALGGFRKPKEKNGVSPFQAACTALSSTVGTGNIAGVAGAVALGGAGAVFWMWISALAGMVIKAGEIILALSFREKKNGEPVGGPMYYIKNGLPKAFAPLAGIFSLAGLCAVFFSGNLTQTNAAVNALYDSPRGKLLGGAAFAAVTALVMLGGTKRIGRFTEKTVPVMALLYIGMTIGVLGTHIGALPGALRDIVSGAFRPAAVTGGAVGSMLTAVTIGASRGVFSNEAGLGTSAMAHAASAENGGVRQSLYGIFEVFTDTMVISTLTALTILVSGVKIEYGTTASAELVGSAFSGVYGKTAPWLLAGMMCLFGISSVIGWGYYGTVCAGFLFGGRGKRVFVFVYPFLCIVGAVCQADTAWRLSALFNGIMLCVNVFAVLLAAPAVIEPMREFAKNRKRKKDDTG